MISVSAHVLRARVDVPDDRGGLAADERLRVRGAERGAKRGDLVRADDQGGEVAVPALGPSLGQGLDDADYRCRG
jgi:hypothetical protein